MTSSTIEVQAVKVGDIFYTSWGYDQTNVEFFKVVRCTDKSVWVQETGQKCQYSEHGNGDYWTTVSDGQPLVREMRDWENGGYKKVTAGISMHRLRARYNGSPAFSINSFSSARLWDGTPVHASTGH